MQVVWTGLLPPYWHVSSFAHLSGSHVAILFKEPKTRERLLRVVNLSGGESIQRRVAVNSILGSIEANVIVAKLDDARTHMEVNRLSSYVLETGDLRWSSSSTYLVEKYKLPAITATNKTSYRLGNQLLDLENGCSTYNIEHVGTTWAVDDHNIFRQMGSTLSCLSQGTVRWTKEGYYGNWFQGTRGNDAYFLTPESTVEVISVHSGELVHQEYLSDIKKQSGQLNGDFDLKNDLSHGRVSLYDAVLYQNFIAWVTNEQQVVIHNFETGERRSVAVKVPGEVFLQSMNEAYVLLYVISENDECELVVVNWRGFWWDK